MYESDGKYESCSHRLVSADNERKRAREATRKTTIAWRRKVLYQFYRSLEILISMFVRMRYG